MKAPGGPHRIPGAFCFQGQGVLSGYPKYLVPLLENVNCQDSTPPAPLLPFPKDVIGGLAYPANKYGLVLHEKS